MEFNKEEEAKKALEIAEKKLSENDYNEAKKYLNKAQDLYPKLDGLEQVRLMINVYISASNKINGEADWYGILSVDPLADDEAVKKQYKKLALLLHPDKNKFTGAEGAVKLVLEAWSLLSDKAKRSAYDQKRKPKQVFKQKKSKVQKKTKPREWDSDSESEFEANFEPDLKPKYDNPWKTGHDEVFSFWTMCKNEKCNIYCTLARAYLSKTVRCPNCRQDFVATEITSKIIDGRRVRSFKANFQSRSESTTDASSSSSTTSGTDSTHQEQEKESREKSHADVVVKVVARSRGNANEEERLFKKMKTGNTRLMTLQAKRRQEMKNRLLKEIDAFSSNLSQMRNNK
ncbi:Chaperone protein dnaJ 49 [Cardamine amara subsp. amara]|uniref:Chaperone protein dnaJ 49 n=1 Tax=Cardamine amara subsp. amara TaxID=228776 RepID=A0ABD1A8F8_CARAN